MRRSICFFAFMMAILCFSLTASKLIAGDKTRDNFFPVARVVTTPVLLTNDTAFSFLVEGGPRSYRFNGTLGFICDCNRFKITAEELTQRLHYHFDSGKTHHWMHQFAIGGQYQYLLPCPCWIDGLQLGLSYSNATGKSLDPEQLASTTFNLRRIAGSWSWMAEAGLIITPWNCAKFIGSITYDQVRYRREYDDGKRVSGVGFTLEFAQRFCRDFEFNIEFDYKQVYNNLEAAVRWYKEFGFGDLDVGIFANHVWGKRNLPSSTTAGVELGFAFGICECNIVPLGIDSYDDCCNPCCYDTYDLLTWVANPAVYMPQVLAITDQTVCTAPTLSTGGDVFSSVGVCNGDTPPTSYPTVSFFNSGDSIVHYKASGLPPGSSIDPDSGEITLVNEAPCGSDSTTTTVFVTAYDDCGSETGSFTVFLNNCCSPP